MGDQHATDHSFVGVRSEPSHLCDRRFKTDATFSLDENHFACASLSMRASANISTIFFIRSEDVSGVSTLNDRPERSTYCGSEASSMFERIMILYTDVRASHVGEENSIMRRFMCFALGVRNRWIRTPFFKRFFVI